MASVTKGSAVAMAVASTALAASPTEEVLQGCYYKDHKYDGHRLHGKAFEADEYTSCQKLCQKDDDCHFFTYFDETKECYKLGKDSVYDDKNSLGAVSGPKFCPNIPSSCVELPHAGFPGATPDETEKLFPSHRQPTKLECWPRNAQEGLYDSCPTKTVLEDSKFGWPAMCMNLMARSGPHKQASTPAIPQDETCESECTKNPECSMWVVVNDTANSCWQGLGNNCYQREGFAGVLRAQRILHGKVRVLASLAGVQIWGLRKAFDSNYFLKQEPDAVHACRNHCYSNIHCQYWQYSSVTGCWTEEPNAGDSSDAVAYPLTREVATANSHMAKFIIAGEYIQHICPGAHHIPEKFSAAFLPGDLRFVAQAEQSHEDLYSELKSQYPSIHGAPSSNTHLYGSAAYHAAYENAGKSDEKVRAISGSPAKALGTAATERTEVLYKIENDDPAPRHTNAAEAALAASGLLAIVAVAGVYITYSVHHCQQVTLPAFSRLLFVVASVL
eukprot:TRINITY_DN329_c0_g3_i1.p1 TRINITY_DN329_c0_g3~~TRINITY_DN329_c0_g3_i1.p1  ORF type:complete len:501 (+),score=78.66 TRINITY_DN329_c0_g3_i1:74-1576(+)